jgi:prepilin-type N-terminal cleavage/methylation domain-containing protein
MASYDYDEEYTGSGKFLTPCGTHAMISHRASNRAGAFTLVELLVVVVIIALLASILVPVVQVAVEKGRRTRCASKLHNLYKAAAMYGSENKNFAPVVHDGAGPAATGNILARGGQFAKEYMDQAWTVSGSYADMLTDDNVFQCPAALENTEPSPINNKRTSTNYRLGGFGVYTTAGDVGMRPSMMTIKGSVQPRSGTYPVGEVAMAMDWIWLRSGAGLSGNGSLANHSNGANVLYGSGEVKWVNYNSMIEVSGETGLIVPRSTYGFYGSGASIYTPEGNVTGGGADRKAALGVMW